MNSILDQYTIEELLHEMRANAQSLRDELSAANRELRETNNGPSLEVQIVNIHGTLFFEIYWYWNTFVHQPGSDIKRIRHEIGKPRGEYWYSLNSFEQAEPWERQFAAEIEERFGAMRKTQELLREIINASLALDEVANTALTAISLHAPDDLN